MTDNTYGDKPYLVPADTIKVGDRVTYVDLPPVPETLPMDSDIENLKARNEELTKLNAEYLAQKERYYDLNNKALNRAYTLQNSVKDWMIEKISNDQMTKETAEELAELMGFDCTRTVPVTGTISFSGELEISIFDPNPEFSQYDAEIPYLDIRVLGEDISNLDYSVEDLDIDLY